MSWHSVIHSFIHSFIHSQETTSTRQDTETDGQRGMHISRILFSSKGSFRASFLYTVALHPLVASPRPAVRTLHTLNLSLTSTPSRPSKFVATPAASNLHTQQAISQSLHHICCPSSPHPPVWVVATGLVPARHQTTPRPRAGHSHSQSSSGTGSGHWALTLPSLPAGIPKIPKTQTWATTTRRRRWTTSTSPMVMATPSTQTRRISMFLPRRHHSRGGSP